MFVTGQLLNVMHKNYVCLSHSSTLNSLANQLMSAHDMLKASGLTDKPSSDLLKTLKGETQI